MSFLGHSVSILALMRDNGKIDKNIFCRKFDSKKLLFWTVFEFSLQFRIWKSKNSFLIFNIFWHPVLQPLNEILENSTDIFCSKFEIELRLLDEFLNLAYSLGLIVKIQKLVSNIFFLTPCISAPCQVIENR